MGNFKMPLSSGGNLGETPETLIKIALDENLASGISLSEFKSIEDFILFGITQYLIKSTDLGNMMDTKILLKSIIQNLYFQYDATFSTEMNAISKKVQNTNTLNMKYRVYYGGGKFEVYARDFRNDTRYLDSFNKTASPYPDFILNDIDPENLPKYRIWFSIQDGNDSTWCDSWEFYKTILVLRSDVATDPDLLMDVSRDIMKLFSVIQYMILNGIVDSNERLPEIMNSQIFDNILNIDLDTMTGPINLDAIFSESSEDTIQEQTDIEESTDENLVELPDPDPVDYAVTSASFNMKDIRLFTSQVFDEVHSDKAISLWPRLRALDSTETIRFLKRCRYYFYDDRILNNIMIIFKKDRETARKILKRARICSITTQSPEHIALMKKFYRFTFRDDTFDLDCNLVECRRTITGLRKSDIQTLLKWAFELRKDFDTIYDINMMSTLSGAIKTAGVDELFLIQAFNDAGFICE